jgi:hypothetical protein
MFFGCAALEICPLRGRTYYFDKGRRKYDGED